MIYQKNNKTDLIHIAILLFSALAIRVCAFYKTTLMNLDGPVYIHQARAIYNGLWGAISTCSSVDYPTLYTFLIAAFYPVVGDWTHAAMMVNLIFGTLMIIPLYLFLRRFVDEESSFVTTFIFAMLPVFVVQSVNIIRDPSFWFFSILGLYFLVSDDSKRTPYLLILSSLSFIIATATRLEGIVFILGGCFYSLLVFKERRLRAALLFLSPVILALFVFIAFQWIRHPDKLYWYRFREIPWMLSKTLKHYHHIEASLTRLLSDMPPNGMRRFIENARTFIWFTALGVILQSTWEAFFYYFFFVLLLGLTGIIKRIRNDARILSLVIMSVIGFAVLYLYCLNIWSMENRRIIMVMIPSAIFVGFGIQKIIGWMNNKINLPESSAVVILCALVLLVTLPKNIRPQETDKLVFKEVGQTIAMSDGGTEEIEVMTLGETFRWINYFANLHVSGAPCPDKNGDWRENRGIVDSSYKDFIKNIRTKKIRYIVWEEKHWPPDTFSFLESVRPEDLKKLKDWAHPDSGRIILYKVLYPQKR